MSNEKNDRVRITVEFRNGIFEEYVYRALCKLIMHKHGLLDSYAIITYCNYDEELETALEGNRNAVEEIEETWKNLNTDVLKDLKEKIDKICEERLSSLV